MGSCLARIYEFEKPGTTLEFEMLISTPDLTTLKLHTEYYRNIYRNIGFTEIIESGRKALQYKVRLMVAHDFNHVDVELVSARGDGIVVGRFKTKAEAQEFILVYYGTDNPYRFPVYASNSLTREVLAKTRERGLTL